MVEVTYEIVEHDGGWAYKVDGVFSEPYPSHAAALAAAQRAAAEQTVPGHTETIEYEDEKGRWPDAPRAQYSGELKCFNCVFSRSRYCWLRLCQPIRRLLCLRPLQRCRTSTRASMTVDA